MAPILAQKSVRLVRWWSYFRRDRRHFWGKCSKVTQETNFFHFFIHFLDQERKFMRILLHLWGFNSVIFHSISLFVQVSFFVHQKKYFLFKNLCKSTYFKNHKNVSYYIYYAKRSKSHLKIGIRIKYRFWIDLKTLVIIDRSTYPKTRTSQDTVFTRNNSFHLNKVALKWGGNRRNSATRKSPRKWPSHGQSKQTLASNFRAFFLPREGP